MRNTFIIQGKPKNVNIQYVERGEPLTEPVIEIRVNGTVRKIAEKLGKPLQPNIAGFVIYNGLVYIRYVDGRIAKKPLTTVDGFMILREFFGNGTNVPKWLTPGSV